MFFSFSTIPADSGRRQRSRPVLQPSRGETILSYGLMFIWLLLISFGAVSAVNPEWLKELSGLGRRAESRDYKNYGDAFLQQHDYRRAIGQYQAALDIRPGQASVLINMAVAYMQAGAADRAVEILRAALETETDRDELIYFNLGELLEKQGISDDAAAYYQRAIGSTVEQDLVYRKLGGLYVSAGRYEDALPAFENTLLCQMDPCQPYLSMVNRSLQTYKEDTINLPIIERLASHDVSVDDLDRYDLEIIHQLQQSDPEIAKTHNNLGFIHFRLGNIEAGIRHFEKSLQIWPGNADASRNLPLLRQMLHDGPDANVDGD